MPDIEPRFLEILVCPVTKGPLEYDRHNQELLSQGAGLAYPIRNGIPIMLPDEARSLGSNPSLSSDTDSQEKSIGSND